MLSPTARRPSPATGFNGIIALTAVLGLKVKSRALWNAIRRNPRDLMLHGLGAVSGVSLALAAARDVRLIPLRRRAAFCHMAALPLPITPPRVRV